jgi:Secretion system C-terminal sorting domain
MVNQLKNKNKMVFSKKVIALSCLLFSLILKSGLHAQIVYTDIPDATPSATFSLDLNNDQIDDFAIYYAALDRVMCTPANNNAYSGEFVAGEYLPWALSQSASICDSLMTWYDANNPGTMAWGTSIGNWVGETDKYLALKLVVGANTYYGWARLDILPTSTSFTVKDYAYESTADACILAGEITLGLHENSSQNVAAIFPNPVVSVATIQTTRNLDNANLTICNAFGQAVRQVKNISGQRVVLSRGDLASGMYFIRLTEGNKVVAVEKFIVAD